MQVRKRVDTRSRPDIRTITRLVPRNGNLVQGQSELAINSDLARAANSFICANQNHYSPAEGVGELREAVGKKIALFNGIEVDPQATPFELLITSGATSGLIAIAHTHLRGQAALVFEPYYPYHRRILEELGGCAEVFPLSVNNLELDDDELLAHCRKLKSRQTFPLRAIIACSPANPTGKVFSKQELETIAQVCRELDLLCISDEVYEHYVVGEGRHISIASLEGMWHRTITVNSFSKSWNISGWRLGYAYGAPQLVSPLNNANNVFYVCPPTPLQRALAEVLVSNPHYYAELREKFVSKRQVAVEVLERVGFKIYDSGSTFYVWAQIPEAYHDAMELNQFLIREGVAGVPGSAFADSDLFDDHMRFCIAREDDILHEALTRIQATVSKTLK